MWDFNSYNAGQQAEQSRQQTREFWAREHAAGRGPEDAFASLLVLSVCVAIPAAAVWGLRVWLGEWSLFVEHPMIAKSVYGTVAIFLFSACYTFHRVIRMLLAFLAAALLTLLFLGLLWSIVVLIFDVIH